MHICVLQTEPSIPLTWALQGSPPPRRTHVSHWHKLGPRVELRVLLPQPALAGGDAIIVAVVHALRLFSCLSLLFALLPIGLGLPWLSGSRRSTFLRPVSLGLSQRGMGGSECLFWAKVVRASGDLPREGWTPSVGAPNTHTRGCLSQPRGWSRCRQPAATPTLPRPGSAGLPSSC